MTRNRTSKVTALVGAQFGSEGKGIVVNHIAKEYEVHVRTGAPNAGHTFYHQGRKYVMQTIPCGWTNPDATLVIGPGALIDMDILVKELKMVHAVDPTIRRRLFIDEHAGVISSKHSYEEGGNGGELHHRIGSTGKGVGAARRDRMGRDPDFFQFFGQVASNYTFGNGYGEDISVMELMYDDTAQLLSTLYRETNSNFLFEGAQGSGLSLIHGHWPYVTTCDTNAAQMCADAGFPPQYVTDVMLVARTFPIRVAGNSGPMSEEINWDTISARMGRPTQELTTVTKKVRRIGMWDEYEVERAVMLNGATEMVVTFMDYLSPEDEGKENWKDLSKASMSFIDYVRTKFNVHVPFVVTGGVDFPHVCNLWFR